MSPLGRATRPHGVRRARHPQLGRSSALDNEDMPAEEWRTAGHVRRYLGRADGYPRRAEGESVLLEHVPRDARRILDLGTGDGRLLALLGRNREEMRGVSLDFSEPML